MLLSSGVCLSPVFWLLSHGLGLPSQMRVSTYYGLWVDFLSLRKSLVVKNAQGVHYVGLPLHRSIFERACLTDLFAGLSFAQRSNIHGRVPDIA